MAKISFYLTDPKTKNETKLYSFINYGLSIPAANGRRKYLPLKYSTDIEVIPDLWNGEANRVKQSIKWATDESFGISRSAAEESAKKRYDEINRRIEKFISDAKEILRRLSVNGGLPSHIQVRRELDKIYHPERVSEFLDTEKFRYMNFVEYIGHIVKTSSNLKTSTIRSYEVVRKNIEDFQKKYKYIVTPQNADIDFYNQFVNYLTELRLAKNTIGTRVKIIKTVLHFADDKINGVSQDYKKDAFKKPREETDSIYLTPEELNSIYKLKMPKYLDRVRDLFLIGCDTGLRFSDLTRLAKDNITHDNTIKIKTQKTGTEIITPITPRVRNIFEKYDYNLPKPISNQKFNTCLKDIARRAGIVELIARNITKGGMIVSGTVEKCELVTSHAARRSFATNAFLADIPAIAIMKITGHKTESAFMKYIKMTAKDNAIKLQTHKFFTQMAVVK